MKRTNRLTVHAALLLSGLLAPLVALCEPDPSYSRLSRELVSPHIPFANPCRGGGVKALVIAPTMTQRETVELAQRLSMDYVPLMVNGYGNFGPYGNAQEREYGGIAPEEFQADVDRKLADDANYGLIVIGKIKWDSMPESVRARILDKVKRGTGLLYVNPWGKLAPELEQALTADGPAVKAVTRGLPPLALLPRFKTGDGMPLVRCGNLGKGRVVALDYGEGDPKTGVSAPRWNDMLECLTPFQSDDALYYDYWHALLARACLWAAKKEAAAQLSAPAAALVLDQKELGAKPVNLTVGGELPLEPCFLHWVVRDRYNQIEGAGTIPCAAAAASLTLPYLRGGDKVLDVWLRDNSARVVDWVSIALVVKASTAISGVELAKDVVQKGEPMSGKVVLASPLTGGQELKLTAMDSFGRVVHESTPSMSGGTGGDFALTIEDPLSRSYSLIVQVVEGGRVVDERRTPFFVNTTDFDHLTQDFTFHIWDAPKPKSRSSRIWLEEFKRSGIDTIYQTSALFDGRESAAQIVRTIAAANLLAAPYATRLVLGMESVPHGKAVEGPDGPMLPAERNPLAKSLDELRPKLAQIQNVARDYGPFGALYYSLGDENALSAPPYKDLCFSEQSQKSFRAYVKDAYPTLAALNAEWGTDYKSWDDVKPITFANAAKLNRYPQWLDHRMHMDKLFAQYHRVNAQAIREVDPQAKIGMEGPIYPGCSYTGFNLYDMLADFQYFTPYPHVPEIHTFSFMSSPSIRGTWFGSYEGNPVEYIQYMPWHMLFEGGNSVSWWYSGLGGSSGLPGLRGYSADLLPQPQLERSGQEVLEIKAGLGKLLIASERVVQPIGVYFSNPCLHASTIRSVETTWEQSLQDFHCALRDAGFDYRFLTPPELMSGAWRNCKVIILPYAQAISAKEAAQLEDFVRGGGLLLADFAPGIMDEHGKMLEKSSLSGLFGGFNRLQTNAVGKGKAVCLADYLRGYATQRNKGLGRGVCDGLARLLGDLAGVQPYAVVKDAQGKRRQDVEVSLFKNGDAEYLACLRLFAGKSSESATGAEGNSAAGLSGKSSPVSSVSLASGRHVYEARSHAYLGWLKTIDTEFAPGQAKVYALLPDKVEGLRLELSKPECQPGETLRVSGSILPASLGKCGMVVRLQVEHEGKPLPHYDANIAYHGQFERSIPLALNDPPGKYTVIASDVVSGKVATATFVVKKGSGK